MPSDPKQVQRHEEQPDDTQTLLVDTEAMPPPKRRGTDETPSIKRSADELLVVSAPKRSKVSSYKETDVSDWTTRMKGKNSFGSPIVNVSCSTGFPRFALHPREDSRSTIPFKLDLEPVNGGLLPAFLSGGVVKTSEGLDLQITLSSQLAEFVEKMDVWMLKEAFTNSKEWFGRQYSEVELASMYTPCLKKDNEGRYPPKMKSKITLAGQTEYLTQVIAKRDSMQLEGAGWDFVKPLLGPSQWRGNEIRAVLLVRSVWIVGKKFGLRTNFTNLLVAEKEHVSFEADFPELDE